MIDRQLCRIPNCSNWSELRNTIGGIRRYRSLCEVHRRPKRQNRSEFNFNKCDICHESVKSQRHRTGGVGTPYTKENVIMMCKDCHYIEHGKHYSHLTPEEN